MNFNSAFLILNSSSSEVFPLGIPFWPSNFKASKSLSDIVILNVGISSSVNSKSSARFIDSPIKALFVET